MASDMYFWLEPDSKEKAFVDYILHKVDQLTGKDSSQIRYQKIVINVARKLNLPITRFWYHLGEITTYTASHSACSQQETLLQMIRPELGEEKLQELDDEIKKSGEIFTPEMSADEIRQTQYSLYGNEKYLCLLEITKALRYGFKENEEEILFLMSKFLNLIPREGPYLDFYDKYFEYVLLVKKLVFSKSKLENILILNTFTDYVDYFTAIEGLMTAVGPNADQLKRKIKESIPQAKYRVAGAYNQLLRVYESNCFPDIVLESPIETEAFSTMLEIEELIN